MYEIKTINSRDEIALGNCAEVSVYNWGGDYRPQTTAVLCWLDGKGFLVRMECQEENPRATFTVKEPNSGVCRDSCLEFFANFAPEQTGSGYINFECNANGSLLCCYGPDRHQRQTILEMGLPHPVVTTVQKDGKWGFELLISLEMLLSVYGKADFGLGSIIKGNFYKCGDDTAQPHYGAFTAISSPHPDFHRPECFAEMQIV